MKKDQRQHDKEKYPSNPTWGMRLSPTQKAEFMAAARKDGAHLATWLKRMARDRIKEQREEEGLE